MSHAEDPAEVARHAPDQASPVETLSPALFEAAADREAIEQAAAAAAAVAPERADLAMLQTLDPALRPAMYHLLASLADNKYLLGRRYGEWCTGAPTLESAVASAAMAQDELGHARSFYPLLRGFPESGEHPVSMEERGWQQRHVDGLAPLDERFPSWPDFIAVNFVVDTAFTILFEAAQDSRYEPLRQRARKIMQEEAGHWVHADRWTVRLSRDEARRPVLDHALARVWDDALAWYGPPDDAVVDVLHQGGMLAAGPDRLRQNLQDRLLKALSEGGLGDGVAGRRIDWARWDQDTRRLAPSGS